MGTYEFTTEVNVDFNGSEAKAWMNWSLELDVRAWGVKDAVVAVPEQDITIVVEVFDEQGEEIEREMTFSLGGCKIEVGTQWTSSLCPVLIEVLRNEVKVVFG